MSRAISHLPPSMQPVAVGAQQPQVASVGLPIAQAVVPGSRTALLQAAVNVVNVENAIVSFATINARSAKFRNEGQLSTPVARMLVPLVRVGRPIGIAASDGAKAMLAGLSALLALRSALPSGGEIAVPPAVFPGAVSQPVKMGFKGLGAMRASDFDGALFHPRNMAQNKAQPKYFDVACKRIEDAQRQGDFFVERAA